VVLHDRRGAIIAVVATRVSYAKAMRYLKSKSCKQIPIQYSYSVVPVGLPEGLGDYPRKSVAANMTRRDCTLWRDCTHMNLDRAGACIACGQYIHSLD
jgi:hypothetical protein